ncbi:MAG: AI-2E family transporter, partial [Thermoguttaceae bacterium]
MAIPEGDARTYWNVQTFCLLTLTLIALGGALYFLRPVLVPFVLAVLLSQCLVPAIEFQQRRLRVPRGIAIAVTAVAAVVVVAGSGTLIATTIASAAPRLQEYEKQFQKFTEGTARSAALSGSRFNMDADKLARFFAVQEGTGWQFITAVLGEATNIVSSGVIVIIFMVFLLAG